MGVDGFWPIVSSKGKRVTLDVLSDKVIAIDASIWIYQFANALRDSTGEPIRSSHIVGFFKRICKLLYLRIKPVFVFDGPPIPLKFAALKKRHDDTVPDSMFKRAARQLLLQNLRELQTNANIRGDSVPVFQQVQSEDESSVDEIHVVTDSSSDDGGMSPSRRLRLSVPEAFRGFVAERRTLDSVSLPISPARPLRHREQQKEVDVDANIDEEALKDLPLHEQYRSLLETRTALLSQGRRKALNLATRMGGAVENGNVSDLHQLSMEQIKAVVDLARVTDLSKSIRLQMSRDENKEEVYIPGTIETGETVPAHSSQPPMKKKRKNVADQFGLESQVGSFDDKHSVLSSARLISREELLFDRKAEAEFRPAMKMEPDEMSGGSSLEEDEGFSVSKIFGNDWNEYLPKTEIESLPKVIPVHTSATGTTAVLANQTEIKLVTVEAESEVIPIVHNSDRFPVELESIKISAMESGCPHFSIVEPLAEVSVALEEVTESDEEPVSSEDDEISISINSESEISESPPANPPLQPTTYHCDVSDNDLSLFAELKDPFPFFASDIEELAFDNQVRERINVVESLENTYEEIQQLLTGFGIPWVSAPADAEAQCAFLAQCGLSDGVISDDSDTLIYGSPVVFRHLYIGESTVEIYRNKEIGFSQDELVSLALLLGCDFTVGVRGIGPVNATEIVRHYSGIVGLSRFRAWAERLAADRGREGDPVEGEDPEDAALREFKVSHANYRTQWLFPEDFPSQEVWDVFDKPLVDTSLEPFSWESPDEAMISRVVTSLTSMRQDEVEHLLSSTMSQYRQASVQRRITDYFSPAFERGSVAEVVSKRLKAALR